MAEQEEITWGIDEEDLRTDAGPVGAVSRYGVTYFGDFLGLREIATWVTDAGSREVLADVKTVSYPLVPTAPLELDEYVNYLVQKILAKRLPILTFGDISPELSFVPWREAEEEVTDIKIGYENKVERPLADALEKIDFCLETEDIFMKEHAFGLAISKSRDVFMERRFLSNTQEKLISWVINLGNLYKDEDLNEEQIRFIKKLINLVLNGESLSLNEFVVLTKEALALRLNEVEFGRVEGGWNGCL